ncbi:Hypothetical protein UVM_LOCUS437 [uncultured virus]|nr:Hypothetical protein UVM_LOCUS437 [uncultured virus]
MAALFVIGLLAGGGLGYVLSRNPRVVCTVDQIVPRSARRTTPRCPYGQVIDRTTGLCVAVVTPAGIVVPVVPEPAPRDLPVAAAIPLPPPPPRPPRPTRREPAIRSEPAVVVSPAVASVCQLVDPRTGRCVAQVTPEGSVVVHRPSELAPAPRERGSITPAVAQELAEAALIPSAPPRPICAVRDPVSGRCVGELLTNGDIAPATVASERLQPGVDVRESLLAQIRAGAPLRSAPAGGTPLPANTRLEDILSQALQRRRSSIEEEPELLLERTDFDERYDYDYDDGDDYEREYSAYDEAADEED